MDRNSFGLDPSLEAAGLWQAPDGGFHGLDLPASARRRPAVQVCRLLRDGQHEETLSMLRDRVLRCIEQEATHSEPVVFQAAHLLF